MAPTKVVPTTTQLGVSSVRMLWRGLWQHCPACGAGHTHRRWFHLVDRCSTCDLGFERIAGQSIGYIGLNTIVTFSTTFAVILVGTIVTRPDVNVGALLIGALLSAVVLPIVFTPSSHTLWTAIDLLLRPLRPGEIDPRFVVVDPGDDGAG